MRDFKYILKRIIIGTGIALALMFIKQNVYAYEWTTEGDVNLDVSGNYIQVQAFGIENDNYYSAPSYPVIGTVKSLFNANYTDSDYVSSSNYDRKRVVYPRFITGYKISFPNYVFEPDTNYYVILPVPYTSSQYTSLSLNVSENYVLDSNNYTGSTNVSISSAIFAMSVENDYLLIENYPYIYYFKIFFTVSEETDNVVITIGDIDTTSTRTFTAFNTYSFTDYIIHSTWNASCTSFNASRNCYNITNSSLKPLVYTHIQGSINPDDDGNNLVSDVTSDIKTQIQQIIDGQFTEDLEFPYMNGGGRPFGENSHSLQEMITLPIEFLRSLVTNNNACSGITLPLPGLNGNFTLPCLTSFANGILGAEFVIMLKTILGVVLGFHIMYALYRSVIHILSPDHLVWVDDIF